MTRCPYMMVVGCVTEQCLREGDRTLGGYCYEHITRMDQVACDLFELCLIGKQDGHPCICGRAASAHLREGEVA
jgi:hypothetical protein